MVKKITTETVREYNDRGQCTKEVTTTTTTTEDYTCTPTWQYKPPTYFGSSTGHGSGGTSDPVIFC